MGVGSLYGLLMGKQDPFNSQQVLIFFTWAEVDASSFEAAVDFKEFVEGAFQL